MFFIFSTFCSIFWIICKISTKFGFLTFLFFSRAAVCWFQKFWWNFRKNLNKNRRILRFFLKSKVACRSAEKNFLDKTFCIIRSMTYRTKITDDFFKVRQRYGRNIFKQRKKTWNVIEFQENPSRRICLKKDYCQYQWNPGFTKIKDASIHSVRTSSWGIVFTQKMTYPYRRASWYNFRTQFQNRKENFKSHFRPYPPTCATARSGYH